MCVPGKLTSAGHMTPGEAQTRKELIDPALAKAGWNLNELRSAAMSLEEIFLQLTGTEQAAPAAAAPAEEAATPVAQGEK